MQIDTPQILSIIALLAALGSIAWIKVLSARTFKGIDDKIKALELLISELKSFVLRLETEQRRCSEDLIRAQSYEKIIDQANEQLRNELNNEIQLITHHIDTIHNKITQIDEKLEKLRDRG